MNEKKESLPVWLYQKEINCPACGRVFRDSYPRYTRLRIDYVESDLRPFYVSNIVPFPYDVSVCNNCGYAMLTDCFEDMNEWQRERVRKMILPKFHSRNYPLILTNEQAEERYKLTHLSANVMELKGSKMGYLMLKTAWFYKNINEPKVMTGNSELELSDEVLIYYQKAVDCFEKAYISEEFPIRGMNELTMAYLIAILNYRLKNYEKTGKWLKEGYANREIMKKENARIHDKLIELRKIWREEMEVETVK